MRALVLSLGLLFLSGSLQAEPWKLVKDEAGIQVYLKPDNGSDFHVFRAVTRMRSTLDRLIALQNDVVQACAWMHACNQQRLLAQEGNVSWVYSQFSAPWPIKPRDSIVRVTTEVEAGGRVLRILQGDTEYLPRSEGVVRVSKVDGFWQFTAQGESVEVIYQVSSDPGGSVPAWLANSFVVDAPYNTLYKLRQLAE
ncbi:hypothetical protein DBR00_10220 [Pseudomonas sp. HMWF032]|uniref:START domain-containing protein n=1 Tax=unclassified Pseudomonas TaxID=196821 RepID=UPI000D38E5A3|nr:MULTISPECIES: START domain-containing protein [unclassified Pseudomonas]PTS84291.1 hypothetical protein DBR00_10220 [Pseudomonas sp. HMWF032]PTT82571.1 hypothetical protein DBR41_13490 [Pseudomonas sp. HMWF010]WAC44279.1 START domain-containing protein [Pseudomonas sp. SL4(2022)]